MLYEDENLGLLNEIKDKLLNILLIGIASLIMSVYLYFDDHIKPLIKVRGGGFVLFFLSISILYNYFKANKKLNRLIKKRIYN
jgi:hypothetical protein